MARREERKKPKNNEIEDCHTWHNAGWREKPKKQKNKEMADCQTWHNVARREVPKKSEEQRNGRLLLKTSTIQYGSLNYATWMTLFAGFGD
ncbi:hypothetical protein AVEN_176609-1 [Araneus ventricosus]|uniref:Uncharacterized protein n=2 Tax=Araneus ventricosus TaxID=182803 RepID=A0A4Y2EG50_ARAVE|nr:hypothetical protein AVEN_176609-1 [Araneus ventricosus]